MKCLNLGCGKDYKRSFEQELLGGLHYEEWTNLDFNKEVQADVYADITKRLPFKDNTFDYVYASHILEHIPREKLFKFLEEICRVCKKGAKIDFFTPHFSSILATKCPYHYSYWGIDSFRTFEEISNQNNERYSKARFKVLKQELRLCLRGYETIPLLNLLNFLNPIFNFSKVWQLLMERIWFIGFDEIWFKLEVRK